MMDTIVFMKMVGDTVTPQVRGEHRSLNSHMYAKWSEQRKLRDIRKATCLHVKDLSQRKESESQCKEILDITSIVDDDKKASHPGPNNGKEKAALPNATHSDPDPYDSMPRDALTQKTAPGGSAAGGACAGTSALRCAARRVSFATQLEEDPPDTLHSPCPAASGGRGACAVRVLRAVSHSIKRAIHRARG
jgi:hypothetical protein